MTTRELVRVGEFRVCTDDSGFGAEEAASPVWKGCGGVYLVMCYIYIREV